MSAPNLAPPVGAATKPKQEIKEFGVTSGRQVCHERIVIYGEGGVGKSTLAATLEGAGISPLFLDLEGGTRKLTVDRIDMMNASWVDLVDQARADREHKAIVIDSFTKAVGLAEQYVLDTVPTSSGGKAKSLKSYGWGDGDAYHMEAVRAFLKALDRVSYKRHVVLLCHSTAERVPNPAGADYLQYQPMLPKSNKGDIRGLVRDWADHLLFLEASRDVDKDGKAGGTCTRQIHATSLPHAWAKSRGMSGSYQVEENSSAYWKHFLKTIGGNA